MPVRTAFLAALLTLTPPLPALAATAPPAVAPDAAALQAIVNAAYPKDGPGAAVIVTRGGKTLLSTGRGLADIRAGRAIRADDRLYLASITKMFTAATVTRLASQGKLSLDDPLSNYLPGFPAPSSAATIRQLLNHSSGVKDLTKIPGFMAANRDKDFTTAQLVDLARKQVPTAAPGTAWEYNNTGYLLLGAIVEKVTGQSWSEAIADQVTKPLGLWHTSVVTPAMVTYDGDDAKATAYPPEVPSMASSAGGLVGNASDLARFADGLHHGKLVPPAFYREMTTRAALSGGKTAPYGFGFRIGRLRGSPTYYQGGAMRGVRTETLYLPKEDVFVAVLANSDQPRSAPRPLAERLAAAATGHPFPTFTEVAPDLDRMKPLFGRYADSKREFSFFARDGKLWFAARGESARPVRAAGNGRFFFTSEQSDWFELVSEGRSQPVMRFHVTEDIDAHDVAFAGPMPKPAPVGDSFGVGRYKAETGVEFTIETVPDGTMVAKRGDEPIGPLRALENGQYAIDGTPMRLEFTKTDGKITGLKMFRGARTLEAVKIR